MRKLLFFLLIGSYCQVDTIYAKGNPKKKDEIEYLYVLTADEGNLDVDKKTLELTDIHEKVLAFSDRPHRITYHMKSNEFLKTFDRTFKGNPPNGAMIAEQHAGNEPVAIELKNPKKKRNGQWTFTVASLKGEEKLASHKNMKKVVLFIDDGCNWPSNCTNNPCHRENC